MSADSVRLVDQHGRLLTAKVAGGNERIEMQGQLEEKLRAQLDALLTPMLGAGNFSNEVQVELDMDQVTSARESYDKQGVLRSETQAASQSTATTPATGVPGVLSNTPPPAATAVPAPPAGTPAAPAGTTPPASGESSATRNYELGREVAVSNGAPGKIKRLSVAVALSGAVMAKAKPQDIEQIKALVSAAVGADTQRGDQVAVMVRAFDASQVEAPPFYEQGWFLTLVRYGAALIGVILVLLLGVRPLVRALKREPAPAQIPLSADATIEEQAEAATQKMKDPVTGAIDAALLGQQVSMAQTIVAERPDQAVEALRDMLRPADPEGAKA